MNERVKAIKLLPAIVVAALGANDSFAADFSWAPHLRTMMRLDDNIRTAARHSEGALGFDNGADIDFKAASSTFASELIPHVNIRRFAVGSHLDADEYSVAFNNDLKQQTYDAGLKFSYVRDSTLTTEATDTGRSEDVKNRDSVTVQPSFTYLISDRLQSQTNFLYNDVGYHNAGNSGLIDYTYLQGAQQLTYTWRDNLQLYGRFLASYFDVAEIRSATKSYSGELGAVWNWDPTLTLSGSVGWIQSSVHFVTITPVLVANPFPQVVLVGLPGNGSSGGPIATASIMKSIERASIRLDYARSVSPSGRGAQSTSDDINLNLDYKLTSQLTTFFSGMYEMRAAQGDSLSGVAAANDLNRDYFEIRTGIRYQFLREWFASAFYRYGRRDSTGTGTGTAERASANSIFMTVDYNGLPHNKLDGLE
jgi:hypothetical protein